MAFPMISVIYLFIEYPCFLAAQAAITDTQNWVAQTTDLHFSQLWRLEVWDRVPAVNSGELRSAPVNSAPASKVPSHLGLTP